MQDNTLSKREIEKFYLHFTICKGGNGQIHTTGRQEGYCLHYLHTDESVTAVSELFQTHTQKKLHAILFISCAALYVKQFGLLRETRKAENRFISAVN